MKVLFLRGLLSALLFLPLNHVIAEVHIFKVDRFALERHSTICSRGFARKSVETVLAENSPLLSYLELLSQERLAVVGDKGVTFADNLRRETRCRTIEGKEVCKDVILVSYGSNFGRLCFETPPEIGTPQLIVAGLSDAVEWLDPHPEAHSIEATEFQPSDLLLPDQAHLIEGRFSEDAKLWINVEQEGRMLDIHYPNVCSRAILRGPFRWFQCHNTDFLSEGNIPLMQSNNIFFAGRFAHKGTTYYILRLGYVQNEDFALLWKEDDQWQVSRSPITWIDSRYNY